MPFLYKYLCKPNVSQAAVIFWSCVSTKDEQANMQIARSHAKAAGILHWTDGKLECFGTIKPENSNPVIFSTHGNTEQH